jgi:hypothetical protein
MVADGPTPVEPPLFGGFEWKDALGDYGQLPEWIGYFKHAVANDGWASVVEIWVPRLVPGLASAFFHGVIRTAHAVRAIDAIETSSRQAELARALGYWAARFRPGAPTSDLVPVKETHLEITDAAANGAGHYVARPNIFYLHGVTGAMAVDLLVDHVPPEAANAALSQVRAEHESMYPRTDPAPIVDPTDHWDKELGPTAADSHDPHQVKLVEACWRGFEETGNPAFAAAAERTTGRG